MKTAYIAILVLAAVLFGYSQVRGTDGKMEKQMNNTPKETKTAVFAGGCFWCTESDFEKVPGVIDAISGYTGGHVANPTYHQVSAGGTGHVESVKVIYDPTKVTYEQLLDYFWRHVDPTDAGGQFVDRGSQYRSVIFYANDRQRQLAEASKERLAASGRFSKPIVTQILPLGPFYPAEEYHQDYYKKNPIRYHFYRWNSGRDQFLAKVWGENSDMKEQVKTGMKTEAGDKMKAPATSMETTGTKMEPAMKSEGKDEMKTPSMSTETMGTKTESGMNSGGKEEMKAPGMKTETMGTKMESGMKSEGKDEMKAPEMKTDTMGTKMESGMGKGAMYTIPSDAELRRELTPLQYEVTRKNGTEPAFNNAYWNNHEAGIYVDIISGEPLFSSTDKYDSGTGWPSFTRPLEPGNIVERTDRGFFTVRTEVRSKHADSHLGHVFNDGPKPTGLRYCINSAALRFIPKADLEKDGYGKYLKLFK